VAEPLRFVFEKAGPDGAAVPEVYLPWQMVFYLTGGMVAGIVVSLFTRRVPERKLEDFYALVRTPVRPGEKVPAPCTLPEGAAVPPRRKLLPVRSLEVLVPSATSVLGFAAAWALVGAIILAVWLIARG
jgi:hypothetical protein